MKNSQKMKRMSISDIQKVFREIGNEELASFVGMWKYTYDTIGNLRKTEDDGNPNTATVCVSCDYAAVPGSLTMDNSEFLNLSNGKNVSESTAKNFFKFIYERTDCEWAIKKNKDGACSVSTSHETNHVVLNTDNNTEQIIHSHGRGTNGEPSDQDKATAYGNTIKWTLYYEGKYQDYDFYGKYGGAYY